MFTTNRFSLFFVEYGYDTSKATWLQYVGLGKLAWRSHKAPSVIFKVCHHVLGDFSELLKRGGYFDVRYIECGPLSNPNNGESLYHLYNVKPRTVWFSNAPDLEYALNVSIASVLADCEVKTIGISVPILTAL